MISRKGLQGHCQLNLFFPSYSYSHQEAHMHVLSSYFSFKWKHFTSPLKVFCSRAMTMTSIYISRGSTPSFLCLSPLHPLFPLPSSLALSPPSNSALLCVPSSFLYIYPVFVLLECMKMLALLNDGHGIPTTWGNSRITQRSFGGGLVMMMWQRPWTRPMTLICYHEHLVGGVD